MNWNYLGHAVKLHHEFAVVILLDFQMKVALDSGDVRTGTPTQCGRLKEKFSVNERKTDGRFSAKIFNLDSIIDNGTSCFLEMLFFV